MAKRGKKDRQKSWIARSGPLIFIFVALDVILFCAFYIYLGSFSAVWAFEYFWISLVVLDGALVAFVLAESKGGASRAAVKDADLEDTKWLSVRRMRRLSDFSVRSFNALSRDRDGIVIGAKKTAFGRVRVIETSQLHAMIVGTTGSGKTTGFVDQNIACLSSAKTKPSLVISDPKRELYQKHAKSLKKRGYRVWTLDLRNPYASKKWNPMYVLTRRIELLKKIEHAEYRNGKYYAGEEVFNSLRAAQARKQEVYDELYESAMDLVYTLCPVKNRDQPSWEEGARNLIFGFVLAMCEDCIAGRIEPKQMVLFNVYHNITKYCTDDPQELRKYLLEGRDEFSKVKGLVNTVLITSDRTLTSYLSEVNAYMQQLSDDGILSLTCENQMDILRMDERPSAIFIIVPDERVTRHRFVTLFITQMYKEMVEKANLNMKSHQTKAVELKRNCYFILDEFGNLPRFDAVDQMVTVGRSRGIRFLFVLQSFSQLDVKYGREAADVIKSNCNVKIFIGSDDEKTRQEFSELCGQKKIKSVSVSSSEDGRSSSSASATTRPLITTGMLERLNGDVKGEAVISVRGYDPIETILTPSYRLKKKYFPEGDETRESASPKAFQKEDYVFDISGESLSDFCDAAIRAIEEREKEEEMAEGEDLAALDAEWYAELKRLYDTLDSLSVFLEPSEARELREIDINNVSYMLNFLYEDYLGNTKKPQVKEQIKRTIDKVNGEIFPSLRSMQNRAQRARMTEEI